MKMMKTALLATAAIAAVSTGALAGKANYESDSLVYAAASVPSGYDVIAAADAPAGPSITTSCNVKAGLVYSQVDDGNTYLVDPAPGTDGVFGTADDVAGTLSGKGDNSLDVASGAGCTFNGVTDTAVGEVGASVSMALGWAESKDGSQSISADGWWGYWAFADGMQLGGGVGGSLSGIGYGIESNTTRRFTSAHGTNQGGYNNDPAQLRLSYSSGPLGFAIALEDATRGKDKSGLDDDALGVSGELTYKSDMVSFEVAGGAWNDDDAFSPLNDSAKFLAGAGVGLNVVDGVALHLGAQVGKLQNGSKLKGVSASTKLSLNDAVRFELGAGWEKVGTAKTKSIVGGIYYSPVSQLELGLEADWFDNGTSNDGFTAALSTRYAF